jgi:hypothetical protein
LLALFGLVSGGIFIARAFSAGSHPSKSGHSTTGSSLAVADLARAQAQATAIVKAANSTRTSIVRGARRQAQRQAAAIVAAAQKRARQIAAQPTPVPAAAAPVNTSQPTYYYPTATPAPGVGLTYPTRGSAPSPNLRGLPASWLVVGYNATFGSGPGSAGSVAVINRGGKVFTGTAVVRYTKGGSATASFSGLAPGQSLVLPLNGPRYAGGGYTILVNVH